MSPTPNKLVIASRGSRLALAQTEIVCNRIREIAPSIEIEVLPVRTKGDSDSRGFASMGAKGVFVKELERELIEGRADVAVHSAKDLTAELAEGCDILCIPERASALDKVIGGEGRSGSERLESLPPGSLVGTSSMRRRSLLAEARRDLEIVDLRGNLDTRLRKLADGVVAAAILAAAGLERLPGADPGVVAGGDLDPDWWVPAPAQGALAVEGRVDRDDLIELLAPLNDAAAAAEVRAERAFGFRLEGGCTVPLGCLARATGSDLVVAGYLGDPAGGRGLRDRISGGVAEAERLGFELADAILSAGGDEILADLKDVTQREVPQP